MEVEISFKVLLKSLLKHKWIIIAVTVLVAVLAVVYTIYFVTPIYSATSTSTLLIRDLSSSQGGNLNTTISMMSTYAVQVEGDEAMQYASDMIVDKRTGRPVYTPQQLRAMVSVSFEEGGTILYITAINTNPQNAADIADAVTKAAQRAIDNVNWEITNAPTVPSSPSSPSLTKNVAIAVVLALVISYFICFLFDLYNTKIMSEDQLAEALGVPVLGSIPVVESLTSYKKPQKEESVNEQSK